MATSPPTGNKPSKASSPTLIFVPGIVNRAIHQPGDAFQVAGDRLVTERPGFSRFNNDLDHGFPAIDRGASPLRNNRDRPLHWARSLLADQFLVSWVANSMPGPGHAKIPL